MAFVVRIRLSLADRAGALGQVATVIGVHGGNIVSVDVHSTEGSSAVDDLIVEFPGEPSIDELGTDLTMNAAATILHVEPSRPLDMLTSVLAALRGTEAPTLISALAVVCPSTIWSLRPDEDEGADRAGDQVELAVAVPGSKSPMVGRRPAAMEFTATEKARIDAVVQLWAATGGSVADPSPG